jgi:asparagine synthase (glutamine-hydrolysing)
MAVGGPTAVHMSGGYDSPAVFASGESVLRDRGTGEHLVPVSVSYPVGDPGREDELITEIARFWRVPVQWLDVERIPFFRRAEERAARRDEPYAHVFEEWNRAINDRTRAVGAHVALDGQGGDELFNATEVYLADMLRTGRWLALAREWRARGLRGAGFRSFFRVAVTPLLPPAMRDVAEYVRGRRLFSHLEFVLPAWMRAKLADVQGLERIDRQIIGRAPYTSCAAREAHWFLEHPFCSRIAETMGAIALEHDVEIRSPLWDQRVIALAATRPRWERSSGRENKRLLRRAVRGLLPERVLVPRPRRTGVATGYFDRSMRETFRDYVVGILDGPLVLAELGIVEPGTLRASLAAYLGGAGGSLGLQLYDTLQTELWTRSRLAGQQQWEADTGERALRMATS